MEKKKQSILH
ncbi:Protein of unknown function [Bacillus cereus]|nr:Protein of unknown function [Bacillus cereus]SCN01092.1 Protein of unknown function [Bacillus wiedmannii]